MTYTPVTCNKVGEVNLRACLHTPFVDYTVFAQRAPHFSRIEMDGSTPITKSIVGYASYIDNGTDQSLFTDDTLFGAIGGWYTGNYFMGYALNAGEYSVGYVAQAYSDADDITAPSMTIVNVGDGGVSPPGFTSADNGPVNYQLCGPSVAGGDRISWFEGRGTEMHFLTATTSGLTRQQAFEMDGGEVFRDFAGHTQSWLVDGSDVWILTRKNTAPRTILLVRFTPTVVGDPFDYDKFELTFDDAALNTASSTYGIEIRTTTADTFIVSLEAAPDVWFGKLRFAEISRDGSEYTLYTVAGDSTVEDFALTNSLSLTKTANGNPRLIGWAYSGDDNPIGTYDFTCPGGNTPPTQGHCYARKRTRRKRPNDHGFLIPSGDMNAGGDFLITSGDAGGGRFKWQRVQDD